jgi:aryl-alcohol dehydrogenase-like predicted oxidoreductase
VLGVPALAEAAPRDTNPTAVVPLGRELTASRIGIGTGMRGWERESNQTRLGEEGFDRLLNYCYDQGIRLFDAADLYGTHRHIARAMTGKPRDSYTVVSKIWWRPRGLQEEERPDADVCVKRFLKELDTDYIDLVHLHCVTDPNWPEQLRRQMDILEDLKQQGMIRAHGVSCHSLEALRTAAEEPWVDAVNARVNPFGRKTDGPMEKVVPVLRTMQQGGKGIIGMKLCGEGTLDAEQRHESLRYVMSERLVDVMIVGFESIEQVDAMLAGVRENLARA